MYKVTAIIKIPKRKPFEFVTYAAVELNHEIAEEYVRIAITNKITNWFSRQGEVKSKVTAKELEQISVDIERTDFVNILEPEQ